MATKRKPKKRRSTRMHILTLSDRQGYWVAGVFSKLPSAQIAAERCQLHSGLYARVTTCLVEHRP